MIFLVVLVVVSGYLLGSIPSAYLIGRFWAKIDLRQEGDGHVSATAVYREVGRIAFILNLIVDAAKGVLAVYLATLLTDSGGKSTCARKAMVMSAPPPCTVRWDELLSS